jgi:hypothetical protein
MRSAMDSSFLFYLLACLHLRYFDSGRTAEALVTQRPQLNSTLRTETTERFLRCTLNAEPTRMFSRVRGSSCVCTCLCLCVSAVVDAKQRHGGAPVCANAGVQLRRRRAVVSVPGATCCPHRPTRRARTCLEERVVLVLSMVIVRSYWSRVLRCKLFNLQRAF